MGVVFKIGTDGSGFELLHSFSADTTNGENPYGSLTLDGSTLYGMTYYGGANDVGVIFEMGTTLVELVSFSARECEIPDCILLEWETASEIDNAGFHLWRSDTANGIYSQITDTLIPAESGPTWGAEYAYEDFDVEPGPTYSYELEDIDYSGVSTFHGPVSATVGDSVIILLSPEDGASVSPVTPPTFEWESNSLVRFKLQFSTEPTFQKRVTVVPPDQKKRIVWIEKQFYTPSQKEWGRILRLGNKGKTVYWRVYGEDAAGEGFNSQAFAFTIDD